MRTKTLLTVAAFAVSAVVAHAQSNVYSVNIVGYVNQVLPAGTLMAVSNPLDDGAGNTLNSALAGVPSKSSAQFWTGSGFALSGKTATWSPDASVAPGIGFFITSKTAYTNTYVGELAANSGENVTNSLPATTLVMVGSALPYAGTLNTPELGLLGVPAKSSAQFWNGAGYDLSGKTTTWSPDTAIGVGDGFFINSKTAYDWVQTAP